MAKYYAQKLSIKDDAVTHNERYGEYDDMLYQYFLYCANSVKNDAKTDLDTVEFGSVEQGKIKRERFNHPQPAPEPEPETEPEPEPEGEGENE